MSATPTMSNDRTQATLETDFGQKSLHVGDHVTDAESEADKAMVVVGLSAKSADEFYFDGETTVAEVNPEYDAGSKVVQVAFPDEWDLELDTDDTYAYPRDRLRLAEGIHG